MFDAASPQESLTTTGLPGITAPGSTLTKISLLAESRVEVQPLGQDRREATERRHVNSCRSILLPSKALASSCKSREATRLPFSIFARDRPTNAACQEVG